MTKGDLAFVVQVPKLCNDLPAQIRSAKSITAFKPLLKTFFLKRKILSVCEFLFMYFFYLSSV